eukprot:1364843-Rhodomonas_salina.2
MKREVKVSEQRKSRLHRLHQKQSRAAWAAIAAEEPTEEPAPLPTQPPAPSPHPAACSLLHKLPCPQRQGTTPGLGPSGVL